MRALSCTQPWASLTVHGYKACETRSWSTPYRGPLAIHAPWGFPPFARRLAEEPPFLALLAGLGLHEDTLPRRAVVGVCRLVGCVRISELQARQVQHIGDGYDAVQLGEGHSIDARERALGDYTAGRWAWLLTEQRAFSRPLTTPGNRGVWEWRPPPNLADFEPELAAELERRPRRSVDG